LGGGGYYACLVSLCVHVSRVQSTAISCLQFFPSWGLLFGFMVQNRSMSTDGVVVWQPFDA